MTHPFTRAATRYAKAVSKDGKYDGRPCGQLEILACRRFLDDLAWQTNGDFEWHYHAPAAEQACEFIEEMPHTKGKWARVTKDNDGLLDLEDWQAFTVCNLFGWFQKETGERRFRECYLEIARKNGKTALLAAIAMYMAVADGEYAPEVYLGATSHRQAAIAFNMASQMAKKSELSRGFAQAFGIEVYKEEIRLPDGGKLEPLPANPGDGSSPSFAGIDEYHEHKTAALVNAMETGMGGRDNPIAMKITTAGTNYSGPCWPHRRRMVRLLKGEIEEDRIFAIIFCPDPDDDWHVFENWKKSNPMYGVSVNESYLRGQKAKAEQSTRERNIILTKNYNTWRHALDAYFDTAKWAAGDVALTNDVTQAELKQARCSVALDLAYKNDLVSVTALFELERDKETLFYVKQMFFCPENTVKKDENEHYQDYAHRGEITVTEGGITDFDAVEAYVVDLCKDYNVETVYYDTFGAVQLATNLSNRDDIEIDVCEFLQRAKYTTEPMRWVEALMKDSRFRHEGSQCLTWCIGNVVAKDFADKGVIPRKESAEKKIDGAVTLIMAMTHFYTGEEEEENYYENNNVVLLG